MRQFNLLIFTILLLLTGLGCSQHDVDLEEDVADVIQVEETKPEKQEKVLDNQVAKNEDEDAMESEDAEEEEEEDDDDDDDDEFDDFETEFGEPGKGDVYDPISGYNRFMHGFNDVLYLWVLDPVARGYQWVVPGVARRGINRFFVNLLYPTRVINNLLQLKIKNAGEETLRFMTNTTIGVLGFWDAGDELFGLEAHPEDFGQTLGHYGVGPGFHIVLPFFGPSNLRDMVSLYPEKYYTFGINHESFYLDTISNIESTEVQYGVILFDKINYTSLNIGKYQDLKKDAFDWYLFMRDSYEQNRNKEIKE